MNAMKPLNLRVGAAFTLFRLFQKSQGYPPIELSVNDIVIFGDNDTLLKELGIEGEILETPGHSADSISVLLEDGSLFAGDLAMNILKPLGLKYRPIFSEEPEEVYSSWEKVKTAGAKTVYPSHGDPFPIEKLR
jgi:glyoxylase-like metal-dependent hydrolase (beta-lactamase superfamily II)